MAVDFSGDARRERVAGAKNAPSKIFIALTKPETARPNRHPEGMPDRSRGLSAATPQEPPGRNFRIPRGCQNASLLKLFEAAAMHSLRLLVPRLVLSASDTPSGCDFMPPDSGGLRPPATFFQPFGLESDLLLLLPADFHSTPMIVETKLPLAEALASTTQFMPPKLEIGNAPARRLI